MWPLTLLFLLCCSLIAHAEVFVVSNPDGSVVSISDANDAVVPAGAQVTRIKNAVASDYLAVAQATDFKISGKSMTVDIAKQTKRQTDQTAAGMKIRERALVQKRALHDAYKMMVTEGTKFQSLTDQDFQ